MRTSKVAALLELAGFGAVVFGLSLLSAAAAWIAGGVALVAVALTIEGRL